MLQPAILTQRFMLNLRQLHGTNDAETTSVERKFSQFSVNFRVPSDLLGNIGEPLDQGQLHELEDDDLVMFVLEHLKDHKGPQKLIEGLEPVRPDLSRSRPRLICLPQVLEEEASELAISVWRQIIFESMAYGEGLHTERMMADD